MSLGGGPISSDEEEDVCESPEISVLDNHIWFFGEVNSTNCMTLHTQLFQLYKQQRMLKKGRIVLHLQTEGGCVFAGFNTYDLLRSLTEVVVEIICEGEVASAGTIILLAGTERKIQGIHIV